MDSGTDLYDIKIYALTNKTIYGLWDMQYTVII